jgi:soluble lytic murein transglycosylase
LCASASARHGVVTNSRKEQSWRLGNDEVAIVKACAATEANSSKSEALLAAVSAKANGDLGFALCRLHWLDLTAAAKLALAASSEDLRRQDTDEWWRERRLLARGLIDRAPLRPKSGNLRLRESAWWG